MSGLADNHINSICPFGHCKSKLDVPVLIHTPSAHAYLSTEVQVTAYFACLTLWVSQILLIDSSDSPLKAKILRNMLKICYIKYLYKTLP